MVIWLLTFFSIVLAAFSFSMRTELSAAQSFKEEAEAAALAEAGVARALAEVINIEAKGTAGTAPAPTSWDVSLGRGTYRAVLTDEEGKLPLNRATEDSLRRLLQNTGVRDLRLVDTIVDSILDWIDTDDLHRLNGAESDYYLALPRPYHAKNGEFESLEELLLVRGITPEILHGNVTDPTRLAALLATPPEDRDFRPGEYLGIQRFLGLRSFRVNPSKASLDVLMATGVPAAEALVTLRRRNDAEGAGSPVAAGSAPLRPSATFMIESAGQITGSPLVYRITATIQREIAQGRAKFKVLSWQEGM
jgi:general secretion pathway protein K